MSKHLILLVTMAAVLVTSPTTGSEKDEAQNSDYRLVLKASKHVVDWNNEVRLQATLETSESFRPVGMTYAVQRMSFFHRGKELTVHIDNEPIDRIPTESFPGLAPNMGGLLLTRLSETKAHVSTASKALSPGSFIIRAELDIREATKEGFSTDTVRLTSNWVLVTVKPTMDWLALSQPVEDPDSRESLNAQELLERVYADQEEDTD
jgi:hypothetical protein